MAVNGVSGRQIDGSIMMVICIRQSTPSLSVTRKATFQFPSSIVDDAELFNLYYHLFACRICGCSAVSPFPHLA